ncbi:MAG: ArsA family ATPase [Promethearchaeota archaeon]
MMGLKSLLSSDTMRFVLFGGKGGVGKTSCAAASALWTAQNGKRTLIISTDPAHSLGDSLGVSLPPGETVEVPISRNLWALELSPKSMEGLADEVAGLDGFPLQGQVPFMDSLLDFGSLSPPGVDEAMAFGKVLEYVNDARDDFDIIIFDTAPTGHTLRLLSLPEILSGWIGKLIKLRLKLGRFMTGFKNIFKRKENRDERDDSLELIEKLKVSIDKAKDDLNDPRRTSFVAVMIPEAMAIYETERLLSSLYVYEIPVNYIVVNQLFPETVDCNFCKSRREMQQKHLGEILELYEDEFNITQIPLFDREIKEKEQLQRLAELLVESG